MNGTPKKYYQVKNNIDLSSSSCRICGSVGDATHSKNLFKPLNRSILDKVEELHGGKLLRDKTLPQLICRACDRRVKNAAAFMKIITDTIAEIIKIQKVYRYIAIRSFTWLKSAFYNEFPNCKMSRLPSRRFVFFPGKLYF